LGWDLAAARPHSGSCSPLRTETRQKYLKTLKEGQGVLRGCDDVALSLNVNLTVDLQPNLHSTNDESIDSSCVSRVSSVVTHSALKLVSVSLD